MTQAGFDLRNRLLARAATLFLMLFPATSGAGGRYEVQGVNVLSAPSWMDGALGGAELEITAYPLVAPIPADTSARVTAALAALGGNPKACLLTELRIRAPVPAAALSSLGAPCLTGIKRLTLTLEGPDFEAVTTGLLALPLASELRELDLVFLLPPPSNPITTLTAALPALERLRLDLRGPGSLTPLAVALAVAQPDRLRSLTLATTTSAPVDPSLFAAIAGVPGVQELLLQSDTLDPPATAALLDSGLGERLAWLSVHRVDRDAAVRVGAAAPGIKLDFGCKENCDELRAAWSAARAGARMTEGVIEGEVRLFNDDDARRIAGVTAITGNLSIQGPIDDLSALRGLTTIGGSLSVYGTTLLSSMEGLGGLERVGGSVQITRNLSLRSTAGFASLREVGTRIDIPTCKGGNPHLTEIAFPALESVGESVLISRKPGRLGNADWRVDADPDCGLTYVERVRVSPFRRLVQVGGHPQRGRGLPDTEPALFPALKSVPAPTPPL
jgi:hypothetical protein